MIGLLRFVLAILASPFKSKIRLEAENAVLRHQLIVLRRKRRGRVQLANSDRWFFVQLYRWFPSILKVLTIIRPEMLIHWHQSGFRCYWRWKSRSLGGRPQIEMGLRALIRQMSMENPGSGIGQPLQGGIYMLRWHCNLPRLPQTSWSVRSPVALPLAERLSSGLLMARNDQKKLFLVLKSCCLLTMLYDIERYRKLELGISFYVRLFGKGLCVPKT
jgi:hypothetical protein